MMDMNPGAKFFCSLFLVLLINGLRADEVPSTNVTSNQNGFSKNLIYSTSKFQSTVSFCVQYIIIDLAESFLP